MFTVFIASYGVASTQPLFYTRRGARWEKNAPPCACKKGAGSRLSYGGVHKDSAKTITLWKGLTEMGAQVLGVFLKWP